MQARRLARAVEFKQSGGIAGASRDAIGGGPGVVEMGSGAPDTALGCSKSSTADEHMPDSDDGIAPLQRGRAKPFRVGCMLMASLAQPRASVALFWTPPPIRWLVDRTV